MSRPSKAETKEVKQVEISYKIQMLVEIEGSVETDSTLIENTGIAPFIDWAIEDIEQKLKGECDVLAVKKVELEQDTL